jgi:hypothetical protein
MYAVSKNNQLKKLQTGGKLVTRTMILGECYMTKGNAKTKSMKAACKGKNFVFEKFGKLGCKGVDSLGTTATRTPEDIEGLNGGKCEDLDGNGSYRKQDFSFPACP